MFEEDKLRKIFFPQYVCRVNEFHGDGKKLAYYTSAHVARSVLEKHEFWMTNLSHMNDNSEVAYGCKLLNDLFKSGFEKEFLNVMQEYIGMDRNAAEDVLAQFEKEKLGWKLNTYATCFTEHLDGEDDDGRLSMWRGYGNENGVAMVFDISKIDDALDGSRVNLTPVEFLKIDKLIDEANELLSQIRSKKEELCKYKPEFLKEYIMNVLRFAIISIKHPGFAEEKEWRLVGHAKNLKLNTEEINGMVQQLYKLKLRGFKLAEGLDRIILAPTTDVFAREMTRKAFVRLIEENLRIEHGRAEEMVTVSSIPYR